MGKRYLARRINADEVAVDAELYDALVDCYHRMTKTIVVIENRLLCAVCGESGRHTQHCPLAVVERLNPDNRHETTGDRSDEHE